MSLKISKDLSLPDEAVTQTFAILAKRGVGKTYTASVMVEEMLKGKLHTVVVDPIGVWWGLRSSADGKKEGLPIVVAGGEHGDVPLEPNSGELIANLIIDRRISMVVDISLMRKGEQKRFMIDFAETLYRNNRQALHLVLDEADEFAPQRPMGDDARMLGAIEDIVRRGRARGLGVTLITQRPAVLNKNVLTQIEVLVAMRLTSPQDRQALNEWVKYHADTDSANQMITSLPQLPIGTAWFWSPGWLDIFKKVAIRKRETFDSSSTPKVGQAAVKATKVAPVDLEELKEQLAATIEKQESEDPKLLRRRIIDLEKQLKADKPKVEIKEVEVPVISDEQIQALTTACLQLQQASTDIIEAIKASNHKHVPPAGYPPVIPATARTKGFPGIPDGTKVNLKPKPTDTAQM
jgi:DNA helicase HerA-like ATPase